MAFELNLHNQYMDLTFRPLIRPDGSVGRVGVSNLGPACVDPEVYPNLLTAAPALYQALTHIKARLQHSKDPVVISQVEGIEVILAFAQTGYIGMCGELDAILKGFMK